MKTFASLFSGGGGADIGAKAAGYLLSWGIEYDSDIAKVANGNLGNHIVCADILKCDPKNFECVDWLHASPPCPSFSVAKNGGVETEQDIALSRKTLEFAQVLKPRHFTLENVWGYRDSKSWKLIFDGLRELGYGIDFWHLNSADYGVPQTRKRMIVVANRDGIRPQKPLPTHRKKTESDQQLSMFEMLPNWISWYESIEDLIPTLPDSQFAPWQIARLPEEIKSFILPSSGNTNFGDAHLGKGARFTNEPYHTVSVGDGGVMPRGVLLVSGENSKSQGKKHFYKDDPSCTISTTGAMKAILLLTQQELPMDESHPANTLCYGKRTSESYKAILLSVNGGRSAHTKQDEPRQTITGAHLAGKYRALIISDGDLWKPTLEDDKTVFTQSATNTPTAFIIDGKLNDNQKTVTIKGGAEPVFCITGSAAKTAMKVYAQGRIVSMTTRCLARWQTFPNWYQFPDTKTLVCKIIGNAVPCLLMQRIGESLK